MVHAGGLKKLLSRLLMGGCFGAGSLDGYTTSLLLLTFQNTLAETTT